MEPSYPFGDLQLSIKRANLNLRSAFGTSHSSTTTRTNAVISIKYKDWQGYGEVGLPPKKKYCYLANYNDIEHFFTQYCDHLTNELKNHSTTSKKTCKEWFTTENGDYYKPFDQLGDFFSSLRKENPDEEISYEEAVPTLLLKVLDVYKYVDAENKDQEPEYKYAAMCGIEMAILDLWGVMLKKPLYELVGIEAPKGKKAFYTAALNDDIAIIEQTAEFGLKYTNHLKIKLDHNIDRGIAILERLLKLYESKGREPCTWSIDANSAWNAEVTLEFLQAVQTRLPEFLKYFYMAEQPFPLEKVEIFKHDAQWKLAKEEYEKQGVYIFADESVSRADSIPIIKDYIHGVNIKLEKAGGIRGGLKAYLVAKEFNLKIWLGCMVSTRLSCTCSAHLLALSELGGDLDGDLLVGEETQPFNGGFEWGNEGLVILSDKPGIGLTPK